VDYRETTIKWQKLGDIFKTVLILMMIGNKIGPNAITLMAMLNFGTIIHVQHHSKNSLAVFTEAGYFSISTKSTEIRYDNISNGVRLKMRIST